MTRWRVVFLGPRESLDQRPYFGAIIDVRFSCVYFYLWWFALLIPAEIGGKPRAAA